MKDTESERHTHIGRESKRKRDIERQREREREMGRKYLQKLNRGYFVVNRW